MYKNLINVTNRVYGQLQDDISKDIYKARVLIVLHMIIIT